MNLDQSLAYTALLHFDPNFAAMDMRAGEPLIGKLAAAMTAANPKDRWQFAGWWIAREIERARDAALVACLEAWPADDRTEPLMHGPLCDDWYGDEWRDGHGCDHATCDAIAYGGPPPHNCAVEADHADPISRAYGAYYATCRICELWAYLNEGGWR